VTDELLGVPSRLKQQRPHLALADLAELEDLAGGGTRGGGSGPEGGIGA